MLSIAHATVPDFFRQRELFRTVSDEKLGDEATNLVDCGR